MSDKLSLELVIPKHLNPQEVRVRMAGTNEHPLFCLADVCRVLGHTNPTVASRMLDEDDLNISEAIDSLGRTQQATFVTEAGMYILVMRSKVPQAKPFRKWVTGEVLPCIRKYGCYPAPEAKAVVKREPMSLLAIRDMLDRMIDHDEELEAIRAVQCQQAEELADAKLLAGAAMDCHLSNHGHYSVLAFFRLKGRQVTLKEASSLGVRATRVCRERGIAVGRVRDPRFGTVNTYPESILEELWNSAS